MKSSRINDFPRRQCSLLVVAAATIASIGCSGRYEASVSGNVTLDGIALQRGVVAFHPQAGGPIAHGVIDDQGNYELMTGREQGLPSGKYDVTVVATEAPEERPAGTGPPPPGRRLTSEYISDRKTTDLHFTIEPGKNRIDLVLESQS